MWMVKDNYKPVFQYNIGRVKVFTSFSDSLSLSRRYVFISTYKEKNHAGGW